MVGYIEYTRALMHFEQLAPALSSEETAVIKAILQDRKQYAVFTNLSQFVSKGRRSPLELESPSDDDKNGRFGLAWLMAVARVELGAMTAVFTGNEDSLIKIPPTPFEFEAYTDVLLDGLRTHYWSMSTDRKITPMRTDGRGRDVLRNNQRTTLILALTTAARRFLGNRMSPAQRTELQAWESDIQGIRSLIQTSVQQGTQLN